VTKLYSLKRARRNLILDHGRLLSIRKKILALFILLGLIVLAVYGLYLMGGGASNNREAGGLASSEARTIITLTIWGGSAFITGFGLRDVIGRVMGTRQRNRLKAAQGGGTH
jgi:hypothetical protein